MTEADLSSQKACPHSGTALRLAGEVDLVRIRLLTMQPAGGAPGLDLLKQIPWERHIDLLWVSMTHECDHCLAAFLNGIQIRLSASENGGFCPGTHALEEVYSFGHTATEGDPDDRTDLPSWKAHANVCFACKSWLQAYESANRQSNYPEEDD